MVILRGGVKFPTGGESPRPFCVERCLRLIWCNSRTDGYSPDERRKLVLFRRFFRAENLRACMVLLLLYAMPLGFFPRGFFIAVPITILEGSSYISDIFTYHL